MSDTNKKHILEAKNKVFSATVSYPFNYQEQQTMFTILWALIENKLPTTMDDDCSEELIAAQHRVPKGLAFTVFFKINKDATLKICRITGHGLDITLNK